MKILVYGAGVIGTLYAKRLSGGGHQVTVLARGQRLADIRQHGLVIEDVLSGVRSGVAVPTVERLEPNDRYDLALIIVRRDQLASVVPELTANPHIPALLFMLNNPIGSTELLQAMGDRVMLGFPGAGGTREGNVVRYAMIPQQPTMLGEPDGKQTSRLRSVTKVFRASALKTQTHRDMDGWLKAHAFFVTAISGAIYLAGGDTRRLSENETTLRLMVQGVREGYAAVRALRHAVAPFALKVLFTWLPPRFAVRYWRHFFAAEMAEYVFGRHARGAFTEMREVANDCRIMLQETGVEAPALRRLYAAIDAYASDRRPQSAR
jgi:2-dehydropantoate 2-reductase